MAAAVEHHYERTVRVEAAPEHVLQELAEPESLVRFIPGLELLDRAHGEARSRVRGTVTVGPVVRDLVGVLDIRPDPDLPGVRVDLSWVDLQLVMSCVCELFAAGAETTTVRCVATARSTHSVLRRLNSSVLAALEASVDAFTGRLAVLAAQHAAADRIFRSADVFDPGS